MADLDAVNIYNRVSGSTNLMEAMLGYYSDMTNNKTNRAVEFVGNLGVDGVERLRNQIIEYDVSHNADIAWMFYHSIIEGQNTLGTNISPIISYDNN